MFKFFSRLRKSERWDFNGGIHPPEMKARSSATPVRQLPLPAQLIIPLKQHLGPEGELCVSVGDNVLRGQPLTRGYGRMLPVHAPTSGTISAITPHASAHPSALPELSIVLTADGDDEWMPCEAWHDYQDHSRAALIAKIHQAGVAGLGGAGFPTGAKLAGGGDKINTLIINGAECEPYITADDRLMQDYAAEVIQGVKILAWILQPQQTLIGIEDNKPQAIAMMRRALEQCHAPSIELRVIATKYPSGGAKQLTQILTGRQVPHGGRSSDIGVLMHNVGTAFAVKRAIIDGEPLTERVVTLTGNAVGQPGNVWARLGTPVRHLLTHAGFTSGPEPHVIMGGPLMGFTLPTLEVPVVKITNCLLAPSATELGTPAREKECIRCSACAQSCPADLLPQQLYWFSKGQQHDKAQAYNLSDCIECGACAYVCPSNIPLVQYFRQEKAEIRAIAEEERRTAQAKSRYEARLARLERDKAARSARHQAAAARPAAADSDAIAAALARAQARQQNSQSIEKVRGQRPDNAAVIAARTERKAQARLAEQSAPESTAAEPGTDARKSAVEAAIARAKARKAAAVAADSPALADRAALDSANSPEAGPRKAATDTASAGPVDPRKAAVEAAIARAKARKAAAQSASDSSSVVERHNQPVATAIDSRKAAVEAAIKRAKARRAAISSLSED